MIRTALNFLNAHSEDTIMIGNTMSTDIVAGVEPGLETILVLFLKISKNKNRRFLSGSLCVGAGGFEPPTSRSRTVHSSRTEPRPATTLLYHPS